MSLRLSRQSHCEDAQGTDAISLVCTSGQIKPNGVPFTNGHRPRSNTNPSHSHSRVTFRRVISSLTVPEIKRSKQWRTSDPFWKRLGHPWTLL